MSLSPGWYSLHASARDTDSGVNPTGHTLTLDVAGRSEQLLLTSSLKTRRIIQVRERINHVIVSLEDNLDPSLCLNITLTRITRRRATKRMLKRMNRRFDPVQHKDSIDNTEHVQTDMLRSHGHWPSAEELYQVYHQTNQRGFTPIPYASWLQDHLLALANHWRNTDWNGVPTDKIKLLILTMNDSDRTVWSELRASFATRENGTIYNHHDYINHVRRMMGALENHDMEKFYSYYDEKASFRNIHMPVGSESITLEEDKNGMKEMMENFEITGVDVQGYPDYLNYGLGNAKVVQSWWKLRMTRKSDDKKIEMPLFLIQDFNDEGKITGENAYYSQALMSGK